MFIGAYATALTVLHAPMVPLAAIMVLTVVVGCLAGIVVGAATARLHGPYLAGATLALAVGLPALALYFSDILGGSNGLLFKMRGAPPELAGLVTDNQWKAWVIWFTVLVALVVLATLSRGRLGRRLRAIRDDEAAAAMAGIPVGRTKVTAFVISAGCGSLAGACEAYLLGTATPSSFSLALSLSLLAALVLGGLGSLWGAFWGALALVYLELAGKELADLLGLSSSATTCRWCSSERCSSSSLWPGRWASTARSAASAAWCADGEPTGSSHNHHLIPLHIPLFPYITTRGSVR